MLGIALDGHDVNRLRLVRVNVNREAEIRRQIAADFVPLIARVVAAQHVPMLLHEQHVRSRRVHRDAMNAMADFRVGIGKFVMRLQSAIDRLPGFAAVIGAETPARRDGDVNPVRVFRIEQDRMHGHAARARLPEIAFGAAQSGKFLPRFAAVGRFENRRVFRAGIGRIRIGQRRLDMPDALELPRMLRAVIPLVLSRLRLRKRICCSSPLGMPSGPFKSSGLLPGRVPVLPPSSERWMICPNQPLVCDA